MSNWPPGRCWPVYLSEAAMAAVDSNYTLTADGEAVLDADLAVDAQVEAEAG